MDSALGLSVESFGERHHFFRLYVIENTELMLLPAAAVPLNFCAILYTPWPRFHTYFS